MLVTQRVLTSNGVCRNLKIASNILKDSWSNMKIAVLLKQPASDTATVSRRKFIFVNKVTCLEVI